MSFSGSGKSSLANVLLGRPHSFTGDSDAAFGCFVADHGSDAFTKDTCARAGRFAIDCECAVCIVKPFTFAFYIIIPDNSVGMVMTENL